MKECSECSGALVKCTDCEKTAYCSSCERCMECARAGGDELVFRDVMFDDDVTQVRGLDDEKRTISFVASTTEEDDHGTVIESDWDISRFKRNPVCLYAHNQPVGGMFGGGGGAQVTDTIPIARCEQTRVDGSKLKTIVCFPPEGEDDRSDKVWRALKSKRLNAMSVGFRPGKVVREEKPNGSFRYRLSGCVLYELSICPIGSNAGAVAERSLRILERRAGATPASPVANDRSNQESAMSQTEKKIESMPAASELRADPAITVATLAGILGCDGDEKACLRTITENAQRAKTVETVVAEQKSIVAFAKATRASLNLPDTAGEAEVTKALLDLTARSTKLAEIEPKVKGLEEEMAKRDTAEAEREVMFLCKRGKDFKHSYDESCKNALLALRKVDPKGFAEQHKAALDSLRTFDDEKLFQDIVPGKTDPKTAQRSALRPTPEASSAPPMKFGPEEDANVDLRAKADEIEKDFAAKGKAITRSRALELAYESL